MFALISSQFIGELRNRKTLRVIVSDSSDEEPDEVPIVTKKHRGRPKIDKIKEETIELLEEIDLAVQSLGIEGVAYNKCIYTNRLYDDLGRLVGLYDKSKHMIKGLN